MMIYTNLLFTFFSSGIEDNPTVFYKIIRGSTDQTNKYDTFYLQQRKEGDYTYADVKVNHPLDYERIKEYNLTVRVEVCITRYLFQQISKFLKDSMDVFYGTRTLKSIDYSKNN